MSTKAAITVNRPLEEVRSLWGSPDSMRELGASVSFKEAPGDRGTEVHAALEPGGFAAKLKGSRLPEVKNELRRFKQRVETGEVPRSDAIPDGEKVERKFKRRPAQPLSSDDREKAGVA